MNRDRLTTLVVMYCDTKRDIDALKNAQKQELTTLETKLKNLEATILKKFNEEGLVAIRTEHGTLTKAIKTNLSLADANVFFEFVLKNNATELLYKRVNSLAFEEHIDAYIEIFKQERSDAIKEYQLKLLQEFKTKNYTDQQIAFYLNKYTNDFLREQALQNAVPGISYSLSYNLKLKK